MGKVDGREEEDGRKCCTDAKSCRQPINARQKEMT